MADKKIRLYIQAEIKEAEQRLKKFINSQKNIKKENDKLKQSFSAIGGVIAAGFSIQAIARFTQEAIKLGSQTISLERSFRNLGKAVNFNDESLGKFRKATDGTVSDVDLMIQANNAMLLGIVENDDAFAELIDNAQRLAKAVGQDALFGIESLTTGIGRQSKLMLDNLGIVLDTNLAYEKFAQANDKAVKDLDENERKQAFIQAALESTAAKVAQLGDEELDATDATNQLSAAFKNLQGTVGKELQDEVEDTTGVLIKFIEFANTKISEEGILGYFLSGPKGSLKMLGIDLDKVKVSTRELLDGLNVPVPDLSIRMGIPQLPEVQNKYNEHLEAMKFIDEDYFQARQDLTFGDRLIQDAANKENIDAVKELRKEEAAAYKQKIQENMELAILQGQSAKEAGISVIKAETAKATAALIAKIMQGVPFPLNLALAAGASAEIGRHMDKLYSSFATGGSFITKGRTTLPIGNGVMVGDNASGMERIDVTPLPAPPGNDRNITINISAPLVDETVVDHIIPAIRRAEKLGL